MPDKHKKNTCFLILPGFSPDLTLAREIKRVLETLGYPAFAVNFWGNDEKKDFSKLTMDECKTGITKEIDKLSKEFDFIIGIGISLGGALLLDYAKNSNKLYCVVSVGTPFKLKHKIFIKLGLVFLPPLQFFCKFTKLESKWIASKKVVNYLNKEFVQDFNMVHTKVLLLHSTLDFVADHKVVDGFLNQMSSTQKQVLYFENSDHVIDYDSRIILPVLFDFLSLPSNNLNLI